jgi:hypothetical protein
MEQLQIVLESPWPGLDLELGPALELESRGLELG